MIQFKTLLTKELIEASRDKRAMLSNASAMMICFASFFERGVKHDSI